VIKKCKIQIIHKIEILKINTKILLIKLIINKQITAILKIIKLKSLVRSITLKNKSLTNLPVNKMSTCQISKKEPRAIAPPPKAPIM